MMNSAPDLLLQTIASFDETLAADQGAELAGFFSEDGRLMWPKREDIHGREAIRAASERFFSDYATIAWRPDRQLLEVHGDSAYVIGRFFKVHRRLDNGQVEQVYGRLVELWRLGEDGHWRLSILLSGRFAETEILGRE